MVVHWPPTCHVSSARSDRQVVVLFRVVSTGRLLTESSERLLTESSDRLHNGLVGGRTRRLMTVTCRVNPRSLR